MSHYVIVCPDKYCRGVTIASKKTESKQCMSCNKSYKFNKYKVAFETDDHNQAIAARTQLLTKQSKDGPTFEEIKQSGGLEEQDRVFPKEEKNEDDEKDNRSPKEIVLDSVESVNESTEENIISKCVDDGLDKEKAEKILDRTLQRGYAIKNKGIIELI